MIVPKTPCGRSGGRSQSNSFWLQFGRGESRFRFWAGFPRRGGATGVRNRVRGLHVGTLGQSGMLTVCPLMRCSVASTSDCWSRDGRRGRQREEGGCVGFQTGCNFPAGERDAPRVPPRRQLAVAIAASTSHQDRARTMVHVGCFARDVPRRARQLWHPLPARQTRSFSQNSFIAARQRAKRARKTCCC